MDSVYLICAAVGGSILVIQTLMLVLGWGGEDGDVHDGAVHDGDVHDLHDGEGHDGESSDSFFKFLSVKALVAFLTFFGLVGLAGQEAEWESSAILLTSVGGGSVAMFIIGYIMAGLSKLQSKGNVDLANAVGVAGKVYLRIPGERSGQGKVTLLVQGRKIECKAVTDGAEIPTGAQVKVVAAPGDDTVEVQLVT